MGFKEVTAQMAQQFVMAMFPALVLNCLIYIETMYLNLFEYVILPLASWFVGEICHVGLCYYFLFIKDYGLVGIGYACSISNLVVFLIIMNVSRYNLDLQNASLNKFDKRIYNKAGIAEYFKLGLPCMATLCIQWWSAEIAIIMTGKLGESDQGAAIILFSLISFLDQTTKGIRKGIAIYVGQSVGKSDIPLAKMYLLVA